MASLILSAFAKRWKITELPSKVIQFSCGLVEIGHGYTTRIYNYIYNYICVCDRWDIYIYIHLRYTDRDMGIYINILLLMGTYIIYKWENTVYDRCIG